MSNLNKLNQVRRIVHVDMDAFFASVEELDQPELKQYPVIIGSDPKKGRGRGVVSTCNYIARKFGIHSAMPISKAWQLCPNGVYLPSRFSRYKEISNEIMKIFQNFSPIIEPVSIDEAYLDCTGSQNMFPDDYQLASNIRQSILINIGLSASVGIASNKYIAKIASDLNKPAGITICKVGNERAFLNPLPITRLWGAGKSKIQKLNQHGFYKIGQIANNSLNTLLPILGKQALKFQNLARGQDIRMVNPKWVRKSISEETTFEENITDKSLIIKSISKIADDIGYKLRKEGFKFKCVQFKIRYANFETIIRSKTIYEYADMTKIIKETCLNLYQLIQNRDKEVRLIGIGLTNLLHNNSINYQLPLFKYGMISNDFLKHKKSDQIKDKINNSFSSQLMSCSSL